MDNPLENLDLSDIILVNKILAEEMRSIDSLIEQIDDALVNHYLIKLKDHIDYIIGYILESRDYYEDKETNNEKRSLN